MDGRWSVSKQNNKPPNRTNGTSSRIGPCPDQTSVYSHHGPCVPALHTLYADACMQPTIDVGALDGGSIVHQKKRNWWHAHRRTEGTYRLVRVCSSGAKLKVWHLLYLDFCEYIKIHVFFVNNLSRRK
jgi:hypothetical protein